jgi:pimeloyl-ACP methyl ester carboxylesterase
VISRVFHGWERRLAAGSDDRVVRGFEWGLEWLGQTDGHGDSSACAHLERWADEAVASSETFYRLEPCDDYTLAGPLLSFPSAVRTPHASNDTVRARYFPERSAEGKRRAVLVLPQWNADAKGHVGLCRLLNRFRISALRLSLPYHDERMPPELRRADYIVSSNLGRTVVACRQAVLDARRAIAWLSRQGYESIGILGTSLGSCLSMLTAAHEPLVKAAALNHISPYFADVVWNGLSTEHVRRTLEGRIDLDRLRRIWMPISPYPYLERLAGKRVLLVYAAYDLTFPVHLSRFLVSEFQRRGVDHELTVLPCGHYTTGITPFKWIDGLALCRFLSRSL